MSHKSVSLYSHLSVSLYRYVLLPWMLINVILAISLGMVFMHYILAPMDQSIDEMHSTAEEVNHAVIQMDKTMKLALSGFDAAPDRTKMQNLLGRLLRITPYIYGIAYADVNNPNDPGTYLSISADGEIHHQSLRDLFQSHGKRYRSRPWFTLPISSKTPIWDIPNINSAIKGEYMVSRSWTVRVAPDRLFLVAIDVPMQVFRHSLSRSANHLSDWALYYASHSSDDLQQLHFSDLAVKKSFVSNEMQKRTLMSVFKSDSEHWIFKGGSLYKRIELMDGHLELILRLGLARVGLLICAWLLLVTLLFTLRFVLLKRKLQQLVRRTVEPITVLGEATESIAYNHLEIAPEKQIPRAGIDEIDALLSRFDRMRSNLQTLRETEIRFEKSQAELELAARIQKSFLRPRYSLDIAKAGCEINVRAQYTCAGHLSGDIYDIVATQDALIFLVGDATGKDVTAAIFSTFVLAEFREIAKHCKTPESILNGLNAYLCQMDAENMFISAICLRVDFALGQVHLAVAGHEWPLIRDASGQWRQLETNDADLVLGVLNDYHYRSYVLSLRECSDIVLFTDGVIEVRNPDAMELGSAGLLQFVRNTKATDISHAIIAHCREYSQERAEDDMTVIALHITHEGNNDARI